MEEFVWINALSPLAQSIIFVKVGNVFPTVVFVMGKKIVLQEPVVLMEDVLQFLQEDAQIIANASIMKSVMSDNV